MGLNYAVPGALWPGSALPGQVITGAAPPSVVPPVIFTLGTARHLWSAVTARNNGGGGMFLTQPAVSLQAVQVLVSAIQGGSAYNPAPDPLAFAFVAMPPAGTAAAPAASSGAWLAGTWETDSSGGTPQYWASCLVGPGGTASLAAGTWQVFLKIVNSASGEVPILAGPGLVIS